MYERRRPSGAPRRFVRADSRAVPKSGGRERADPENWASEKLPRETPVGARMALGSVALPFAGFLPWTSLHRERVTERVAAEVTAEELMARYAEGDASAFDALYRAVAPRVFGYLVRLTRNRERAEDLLQITFAKLHRARHSYLVGAPVLPWLIAIARRSFLDDVRYKKVRKEDLSFSGDLPEPQAQPDGIPDELADALVQAVDRLPPKYREAIELTKFGGLSIDEASAVVGATPMAVKLRVHRGYEVLRKQLDRFRRGSDD